MQYMYEPVSQYQDPGSGFTEPSGGSPDTPWSIDMREGATGVPTTSTQGHVAATPTYPPYALASSYEDPRPNTATGLAIWTRRLERLDFNASPANHPLSHGSLQYDNRRHPRAERLGCGRAGAIRFRRVRLACLESIVWYWTRVRWSSPHSGWRAYATGLGTARAHARAVHDR
jgi:hypothetical protein